MLFPGTSSSGFPKYISMPLFLSELRIDVLACTCVFRFLNYDALIAVHF